MNPINFLYVAAIVAPIILVPVYLSIRVRYPMLGSVIGLYALHFTLIDFIIFANGAPYGDMISSVYQTTPTLYWFLSTIPAIALNFYLYKRLGSDLTSILNPILGLFFTFIFFFVGLLLVSLTSTFWQAIMEALYLVPLG